MKNLKKVLALVVVFAMMASTVVFAGSFPDVKDDASYASAVETLVSLGYFKGDDNGNFNPDATITRAEFATIVCRLLGIESSATGACDFTDAKDHWATSYIKMANQYGIVKGYGDGTFGPDDAVKYEEAVKMLVCALGYEPMAVSKGGWPTGYVAVASQIGLLDGITAGGEGTGAARSIVAMMTYNALDIPVMEQDGFGTEISYKIMKKTDDYDKSTLLTKVGIYKLGGIIKANSKVAYGNASKTDAGNVYFEWDDNYDCPEKAFSADEGSKTFTVGNTNAEDLVATRVILYVTKVSSGKYEIVAAELDNDSTVTLTINASDLDDDELNYDYPTTSNSAKPYVKYFKDGSTKSTKVSLDDNYNMIWNNTLLDKVSDIKSLDSDISATVEFIDWDNDNYYDVVKVLEYTHLIAETVNASKGTVETYNGTKVDFDIDNEDAIVSIKDVNGNPMEIKDIEDGDVLALLIGSSSNSGFRPNLNEVKTAKYDSLDVVVLKNSSVTGAVKEYDDADGDLTVKIDDTEYDVALNDKGMYNENKIDLQAEGTFYIGITGEIVGFEGDRVSSGNYGLIMSSYTSTNKSVAPQVTMLTRESKQVTYDFASSVRVVNPNDGKYIKCDVKDNPDTALVNSLKDTTWKDVLTTSDSFRNIMGDVFNDDLDEISSSTRESEVAARLVLYKLNASNQIVEITPASTKGDTVDDYDLGLRSTDSQSYSKNGQKLGKYLLADDAVVFDIDFDNASSSKVTDVSYFTDDSDYTSLIYNKDSDGYYGAAVILESDSVFEEGAGIAVVESKTTKLNSEDTEVTKVIAYKDGEKVELTFDDDKYTEVDSNVSPDDFAVGTVFMYNADSAGIVSKYAVIGQTTVDTKTKKFKFNADFKRNFSADIKDGDAFYFGYISDKTKNDATVTVMVTDAVAGAGYTADVDGDQFTVTKANQYTVTGTKKNTTISTGTYTDGNVDKYDEVTELAYYVLVRTYEDDVVDIVAFDDDGQAVGAIFAPTSAKPVEVEKEEAPATEAPVVEATEAKKEETKEAVEISLDSDL